MPVKSLRGGSGFREELERNLEFSQFSPGVNDSSSVHLTLWGLPHCLGYSVLLLEASFYIGAHCIHDLCSFLWLGSHTAAFMTIFFRTHRISSPDPPHHSPTPTTGLARDEINSTSRKRAPLYLSHYRTLELRGGARSNWPAVLEGVARELALNLKFNFTLTGIARLPHSVKVTACRVHRLRETAQHTPDKHSRNNRNRNNHHSAHPTFLQSLAWPSLLNSYGIKM